MKTIKFSVILFLFSIAGSTVFAQNADEIISKYITTIGGAEKLRAIKGIKMEMTVNAQGMEIPVEMVQQPGGKMYVKINLQGKEMTQMASDGNTIWSTNFMTMKAEKADTESTENAKLSSQDFPDALLDYKTKGYAAEYVGKETKEGTECYKVKFTKKPVTVNGVKQDDVSYYFFDTDNGLPIAIEDEIKEISNNNTDLRLYKSSKFLKTYYDANHIEEYKLIDLSGNDNVGEIINCEIIDDNFDEYTEVKIPYRKKSLFQLLPHEENGFVGNKWKDQSTRWNQLRFQNEVAKHISLINNEGLSTLQYHTYGINKFENNITQINVAI